MSKHTPGPWTVDREDEAFAYVEGPLGHIAKVTLNDNNFQPHDARPIAAAPELLEALEWAVERLREPKVAALWESPEEHEHELEIYENAIRKARGE